MPLGCRSAEPETGSHIQQALRRLHPPEGLLSLRYDLLSLQVVTPPLHVGQELGERVPADDVSAAVGSLAVPDCGYVAKVSCDLDAASVVCTE
jgi:hypothetical protein